MSTTITLFTGMILGGLIYHVINEEIQKFKKKNDNRRHNKRTRNRTNSN